MRILSYLNAFLITTCRNEISENERYDWNIFFIFEAFVNFIRSIFASVIHDVDAFYD